MKYLCVLLLVSLPLLTFGEWYEDEFGAGPLRCPEDHCVHIDECQGIDKAIVLRNIPCKPGGEYVCCAKHPILKEILSASPIADEGQDIRNASTKRDTSATAHTNLGYGYSTYQAVPLPSYGYVQPQQYGYAAQTYDYYQPVQETYTLPTYAPPTYAPPTYAPPTYAPPTYAPPTYAPPSYEEPKNSYGAPQTSYGAPEQSYGAPEQSYGAPQQSYGAPQQSYGAPQQSYGTPEPSYGAPQSTSCIPQPSYGSLRQNSQQPQSSSLSSQSALQSQASTGSQLRSGDLQEPPPPGDQQTKDPASRSFGPRRGRGRRLRTTSQLGCPGELSWREARQCCRRNGLDLVSIESAAEDAEVDAIIERSFLRFAWIGLVRQGEGFFWASTGLPLRGFSDWSRTGGSNIPQPDNREGNEFCVAVMNRFYPGEGVQWHDIGCSHRKEGICQ